MFLSVQPQSVQAQQTELAKAFQSDQQRSVDPCPARGEVHGLDPRGDGFLAVRTGASTRHEQIDELHNGDVVILCDYKDGWHGIVYPGNGQNARQCLTNPKQTVDPEPYRGPCKSGWIHSNWVRPIKG